MRQAHEYSNVHKALDTYEKTRNLQVVDGDQLGQEFFQYTKRLNFQFGEGDIPVFLLKGESYQNLIDDSMLFGDLQKNNLAGLPFDRFIIDLKIPNEKNESFIYVSTDGITISMIPFLYSPKGQTCLVILECFFYENALGQATHWFEDLHLPSYTDQFIQYTLSFCSQMLGKLLTTLHTKGMEPKTIKASEKLNKSRMRAGKKPISDVIIIRPTHYYDRSGEKHMLSGRTVKLHWRRGHTRGVWCGIGEERHLENRYIRPCLVNFNPGDNVPSHKLRVLQ